MAVVPMRKTKVTIGGLIDQLNVTREKRRELAKQDDALKKEYDAAEQQLIELMDAEGCAKSTGKTASAGISETIVFNTVDWDAFMAYLVKSKQVHLVQRRVSTPAVLEVFQAKGSVPGLEPFNKRSISLRAL